MFIRVGATLFSDKEVLDSGVLVVSTVKYMWYHIPDLAELKINILESTVDPNSLAFTEITGNTSLAPRDFILMNLIGVGVVILTLFSRWLSLFFVRQLSLRYPLFLDGYLMIKGKLKQARQIIRLSRTLSKNYDNLKSILINVAKGYAFVAVRIVSSAPSASAAVLATAAVVATASVDVEQANDLWALLLDELSVVRLLASDVGDVVSPDEAGALFGAVYHLDPPTDLPYLSNTDYQQLDAQGKFAYRYWTCQHQMDPLSEVEWRVGFREGETTARFYPWRTLEVESSWMRAHAPYKARSILDIPQVQDGWVRAYKDIRSL